MTKVSHFMVGGKPFLSLGGQTHNSSSYVLDKMGPSWASIKALHGNTMATPIPWDAFEPAEGQFNRKFVTDIIDEARNQGIKLSFLWFASWKNGTMQYCPGWVKRDQARFRRCLLKDGTPIHQLSAHCEANMAADRAAYVELVKTIKEYDSEENTVIAIQIENEAGIQGGTRRDFSELGEAAYQANVPAVLIDYCKANPDCYLAGIWKENGCKEDANWLDTFGYYGAEGVTAYAIANYVDAICAAGKEVYPGLFMYTNVWLDGGKRGNNYNMAGIDWPSGCATIHNVDIYYATVKSLDTIAPDNYSRTLGRHKEVTETYANPGKGFPLYVPESGGGVNLGQMFYAFAHKGAIGYHVFGAESYLNENGMVRPFADAVMHNFYMLDQVKDILFDYQAKGKITAAVQEEGEENIVLNGFDGGWTCPVTFSQYGGGWPSSDFRHRGAPGTKDEEPGRALIFQVSEKEFYVVGHNVRLSFIKYPVDGSYPATLLNYTLSQTNFESVSVTEGHFNENGEYVVDLVRSGDEGRHGTWVKWDCGVVRIELV